VTTNELRNILSIGETIAVEFKQFEGEDLGELKDSSLSKLRSKKRFIPQGHSLLGNFTVLDNVRMPSRLSKTRASADSDTALLLERLGISHLASQFPAQLSGWEIRRAAIARGLCGNPAMLAADEPTSDLDYENAVKLMELLAEAARLGAAVLAATHEREKPAGCSRRLFMGSGLLKSE
jgi:putative ABC transport system ATP-binding protein